MSKVYSVYFMTNKYKTVTYIGITSDLNGRIWEHKNKVYPNSFSAKYNIDTLIFFEDYDTPEEAIEREKQLKNWNRTKKVNLIKESNPNWKDISVDF